MMHVPGIHCYPRGKLGYAVPGPVASRFVDVCDFRLNYLLSSLGPILQVLQHLSYQGLFVGLLWISLSGICVSCDIAG